MWHKSGENGIKKSVWLLIEQDLREKSEGSLEDEEAFESTEWEDFTEVDTYTKKKVNVALITHLKGRGFN